MKERLIRIVGKYLGGCNELCRVYLVLGKVEIIVFKFNCYEFLFVNWKFFLWEDLIFERFLVIFMFLNIYFILIWEKYNMIFRWKFLDIFNICSWGLWNVELFWIWWKI